MSGEFDFSKGIYARWKSPTSNQDWSRKVSVRFIVFHLSIVAAYFTIRRNTKYNIRNNEISERSDIYENYQFRLVYDRIKRYIENVGQIKRFEDRVSEIDVDSRENGRDRWTFRWNLVSFFLNETKCQKRDR